MTRATTTALRHRYGRIRAQQDYTVPDSFRLSWSQNDGPGPEVLGDLTGKTLAGLGAGAARHAAHLAVHHAVHHARPGSTPWTPPRTPRRSRARAAGARRRSGPF
ncbi:hypothetical protein O1L60_40060 [Streptomyces diastatochromogenes]|nr:hypothetical protein [Streptomyces diastatochromogenes]